MRIPLPNKISWRLLLAIIPITVLAIGAIVLMQYGLAREQVLKSVDKEIGALADRTAASIDGLLRQRSSDLFTLAESPLIADYHNNIEYKLFNEAEVNRRALETFLLDFSKRTGVYDEIVYLDAGGREVCAIDRDAARPLSARAPASPFFGEIRKLSAGSSWISPIEELREGGSDIHFAKPIFDEAGRFKGALVLHYDLAQIHSLLKNIQVGRTGAARLQTGPGAFLGEPLTTRRTLSARGRLSQRPWEVIVEAPIDDFLGPLRRIRDAGALTAFLGTTILVGVLLLLVRSITRPVASLVEATRHIARGDLSHRIKKPGKDELGTLSKSFNTMASTLEANREHREQLQSQLIQAEKLSAVGELISSVAHELNNPLAAVCGYVQLPMMEDCPPKLRHDLDNVYRNALRCRKVVDNLLFFVRKSGGGKTRVDLNQAVGSALELLDYRLTKTEDVSVVTELSPEPPEVIGDFQRIVQVLVNLVNNACDAMEGSIRFSEGKKIFIQTRLNGSKAVLTVTDNGPGISPGARDMLFEPFFTTKEPGKGTGLGLSICRQIVEEHGGTLTLGPPPRRGAALQIELPLPTPSELKAAEAPPQAVEFPAVPGKKILVVDDEKDIAVLIGRLLTDDGCRVDVVTQGARALAKAKKTAYDLIISDLEMENVKGQDIFMKLLDENQVPGCRILFITGDILNPKVLDFLQKTRAEYLFKPFDLNELRRTVRRLLAA